MSGGEVMSADYIAEPKQPPRPSMDDMERLHGRPPWIVEVPDFGLPEGAVDKVGMLVLNGRRFARVFPRDWDCEVTSD